MARKTLKQEVIDEQFEQQFQEIDYTRQLGTLDALAKKAEKLRKAIALTFAEDIDEHRGKHDEINSLVMRYTTSYRQAKQAYFNAIALMGFCAHQISFIKENGYTDPVMQHPETSIDEVKNSLDILGEIYG